MKNRSKQIQIAPLNTSDTADIEALLKLCDLPNEDYRQHLDHFAGIIDDHKLIATGALQYEDSAALLRSIAVHPGFRGQGLASAMTDYLLQKARSRKVRQLYILTESAEDYFSRFGFYSIARGAAPDCIQNTRQFQSLCPASAQAMRLDL